MKKILIKQITLLFYLLALSSFAVLSLLNCNANKNSSTTNSGFTPGAPTTDNSEEGSDYIYDPSSETRGSALQHSTAGTTSSSTVSENEARWGTSAPLTITDNLAFEDFRLGEPVNNMDDIKDLRVYVKLSKVGGQGYYAGMVTVAYDDYGREKPFRKVQFHSGSGANAKYNVWFLSRKAFHGFFQEDRGALILVIDRVTPMRTNPDAPIVRTLYGGSIWTMQFRTTFRGKNSCNNHDQQYVFEYNQNLPFGRERIPTLSERNRKCWFLTSGPFDCRTWRTSNGVNTFRGIYPSNCYTKLATFKGLDILKAFGVSSIYQISIY